MESDLGYPVWNAWALPDGRALVNRPDATGRSGLWLRDRQGQETPLPGVLDEANLLAVSPDGSELLASGDDGQLRLWPLPPAPLKSGRAPL